MTIAWPRLKGKIKRSTANNFYDKVTNQISTENFYAKLGQSLLQLKRLAHKSLALAGLEAIAGITLAHQGILSSDLAASSSSILFILLRFLWFLWRLFFRRLFLLAAACTCLTFLNRCVFSFFCVFSFQYCSRRLLLHRPQALARILVESALILHVPSLPK